FQLDANIFLKPFFAFINLFLASLGIRFFENVAKEDQRKIAQKVAIYAFLLCLVTLLAGQYILELFGVTVPVVQLAGGILIAKMGWDLTKDDDEKPKVEVAPTNSFDHLKNKLFYP
ncbi:MAG: MarC family protein, partial [Spirochaetia bacterium]|nr:MarC family protein [Spirochaetia bacterium]